VACEYQFSFAVFRELDRAVQGGVVGFNDAAAFLGGKVHERAEHGLQLGALLCELWHVGSVGVQE